MKQLTTRMSISGVDFKFCASISIESSYNHLTDTAKITVPKKIDYIDSSGNLAAGVDAVFKRGDAVQISLGYDHEIESRFIGYLSGVKTKFPLEFSCEDEMYFLKRSSLNLSLKNPTLKELIKKVIPEGVRYEVHTEQNLGDFRINNATPAEVLNELRKKQGVYSFFRGGVLHIGLAVVPKLQKVVRFTVHKDIIDADGLTYVNDYDKKIKVVAKSIRNDNTQLEVTVGDAEGETKTLYFNNISTLEDLEKIAKANIDPLKYSGYEGSFETFLTPSVNHGDIIEIVNNQIPEQSGAYLCERVVISSGMQGGRQDINIKQKLYSLQKNNSGVWVKI